MLHNKISLIGLAGILALSACTHDRSNKLDQGHSSELVNVAELEAKALSKKDTAEQIALAAEKLALNPGGFIFADELLTKALQEDPQNTRAQFYKALLHPFMVQRGIWSRMKPWMNEQPEESKKAFYEELEQTPNSAIKDFMLDGPQDIKTISDWQSHLSTTRDALLSTRDVWQSLKTKSLTANFQVYGGADNYEIIRACSPKKLAEGVYEIPTCSYQSTISVKLARPDFEALSLSVSTFAVGYTWIFTAYNYEGAERISAQLKKLEETNGGVDYQTGLNIIKSEPKFLTIRDSKALSDIINLGTEGMEALRYVLKHQPELCRKGISDEKNRPGYLYANGICSSADSSHAIVTLHAFLNGPVQVVKEVDPREGHESEDRYLTEINIEQILRNPIGDLRSILPTSVDPNTSKVEFSDNSLGGLFPNNDANTFFNFGAGSKNVDIHPAKALN